MPRQDPKPPGCSPAPALSLYHYLSYLFCARSVASCGDLGHFPKLALQAKQHVAWLLEQSCHWDQTSCLQPWRRQRSFFTCCSSRKNLQFYVEANAAGVPGHRWEIVLEKNSRFVNPDRLRLEVQSDLCSSSNWEPLDVPGKSPSGIRRTWMSRSHVLAVSDSRQKGS